MINSYSFPLTDRILFHDQPVPCRYRYTILRDKEARARTHENWAGQIHVDVNAHRSRERVLLLRNVQVREIWNFHPFISSCYLLRGTPFRQMLQKLKSTHLSSRSQQKFLAVYGFFILFRVTSFIIFKFETFLANIIVFDTFTVLLCTALANLFIFQHSLLYILYIHICNYCSIKLDWSHTGFGKARESFDVNWREKTARKVKLIWAYCEKVEHKTLCLWRKKLRKKGIERQLLAAGEISWRVLNCWPLVVPWELCRRYTHRNKAK